MSTSGIAALIELLARFGVRYVFGNPGTTELPLNDALVTDKRLQYILGLHETPVMAMADGYAMASGQLAVVNVHISCGLGNAMGMLYNAFREGTPLLLTAGQQDRRLAFEEPILGGDMVSVAKPWTKWAVEVSRVEDLPAAIRRAVQTALTPPTGPVFLSIPLDVQMEVSELLDLSPITLPDARVRPPLAALERAAQVLAVAQRPVILAGSRVTERNAMAELVRVAEQLGAPVLSESGTTHGRLAFPSNHPLNGQGLPLWSPEVRERLAAYDVALVVGMDLLRQYCYHEPARAIPEHLRLVHIDEDPWQLGKNYPLEVGVIGDTKTSLAELSPLLQRLASPAQQQAAAERCTVLTREHAAARQTLRERVAEQLPARPMTPLTLMATVAEVLPDNVAVIEEAVTTTNTTIERLGALKNTTGYFGHRGWALGWGLGCSIGVQLAWPDRPVLAILGEGASMYGIQGLWTAARYQIPVTFLLCNNAQYQILKIGAQGLGLPQAEQGVYEGLDLVSPEIDFVALAGSLGIQAQRVSEPEELRHVLTEALADPRPRLIDAAISRDTPGRLNYG
ncbi:thiamine pyrophosphate-binding protein [Lignipirellula cremea]|uniref:Benzoylformate decarboxylase n=1 Tax=Lignipirellula cremea TaxID=2528010 RepID=A0A518DZ21_9BACT|nr:thiamine pyrophosphate-binding protein [Lignipirellula cremea]QDU97086.1 Benzoylformate decarboxylase [Lignipirellula cremea]